MTFHLSVHHFAFRAMESVCFPPSKAGNVLRGAIGHLGDPGRRPGGGPSGLREPPRPFVIRAAHLDGKRIAPGETFYFDVHIFDPASCLRQTFEEVFSALAQTGLGPRRGRVELLQPITCKSVTLGLSPARHAAGRLTLQFLTPTELKGAGSACEAPFGVVFSRALERVGTLRKLYGEGPLPVDFQDLSRRASLVRSVAANLQYVDVSRRSSRTGAVHGIGGFTGTAEYEGDFDEFLPWLQAAFWTGVGRHTVWGNGVIQVAGQP